LIALASESSVTFSPLALAFFYSVVIKSSPEIIHGPREFPHDT
jgi:hypothetical protein